ncbi:MAG TPA: Holliday junction resolvase-like protein [Thermoplasmata archaeon]|nr:Holliday junction resolvase-like protein [Thermoplasmata archaeon]
MVDVLLVAIVLVSVAVSLVAGYAIGKALTTRGLELEYQEREKSAREDSVKKSRSTLTGKLLEQLGPFLPDFRYDPTEVRFIGSPVDCLIFVGASAEECKEVVFLEIKSGRSKKSKVQRRIREAVEQSRVRREEYRIPESQPSS